MKKRISIIMLLTISVLMTGCEELHKKPLAYIETNADDRQSETSETETKKKKETEPETEAVEVVEQGSLETERPETETESETEEDKTEDATPEGELPVLEKTDKTSEEIEMENILQNPELPTGCESVALTMVLKYLGFDLEKTTIADDYLVFADRNFAMGYIGNPHTEDGAGIFAPGLVKTANNFLEAQESEKRGFDISDTDFEDLYNYVAAGIPIIIWNTMYLEKPVPTDEVCEFEGKTYRWFRNEHCMVMCGFDKENGTVLIQDPLDGLVERDAETFAKYYEELGKNARVAGYRIGGKTGTSEDGVNTNKYVTSFCGVAPIDNPQAVVLVTLYNPTGEGGHQGGGVAAPLGGQIFSEILPYLEVNQGNTEEIENVEQIQTPDILNKSIKETEKILKESGLNYIIEDNTEEIDKENTYVKEQTPSAGIVVNKGSNIYLKIK